MATKELFQTLYNSYERRAVNHKTLPFAIYSQYCVYTGLNQIRRERKAIMANETNQQCEKANGHVRDKKSRLDWKTAAIASLIVNIILTGFVLYRRIQDNTPPHIDDLTIVTRPTPKKEFYVSLQGSGFNIESVRVKVRGPGCVSPCEVPNGALLLYGDITNEIIERVPLTVSAGEFQIAAQNGDGPLSNLVVLYVNDVP